MSEGYTLTKLQVIDIVKQKQDSAIRSFLNAPTVERGGRTFIF